MFNLYEILQNAQGGQAVDNLAKQFNISPEQADAAIKALMPDMSAAFLKQSAQPAAFSSMLGALGDTQHLAAFTDPTAALSGETMQKGADVLTQLFGSSQQRADVAQNAAAFAGLPPALIQQMLPVIASMVMGGLSKSLANQGLGGLFGQLANAASQGGLGSILGSLLGGAQGQTTPQGAGAGGIHPNPQADQSGAAAGMGGLAGMFGTILSGFFGQQAGGSAQTGSAPAGAPPNAAPGGFDPATIQSALEALTKMLQPGTPAPPPSQASNLQDEINSIFTGKKPS
ncbi:conserved hypothetical protein [Methylocella silvestris BL2]|uniref:DUF937 domain-containing protein n=1 Tax=Methylocella silvestris (strain DSM 15510 / CIP 108128 / LMG 27833 / NCIMB 13906 / BL2) TaxID=395965 RepID=B8ELZ6_METSB|nr:DUF937 domain-containing protein [Methylocella silvestris]ACK50777.1 conserved hypothetical protein [Methylocella silvestris BL2]